MNTPSTDIEALIVRLEDYEDTGLNDCVTEAEALCDEAAAPVGGVAPAIVKFRLVRPEIRKEPQIDAVADASVIVIGRDLQHVVMARCHRQT